MEKETKKWKGGSEKEREGKKKNLKEIAAKCMSIQEAFARASTSTESQTTVNHHHNFYFCHISFL